MKRGKFITFEGIDGAGKSTLLAGLVQQLNERAIPLVQTREPGGTPVGEALRELVLHQSMQARTETLLVFAARAEHLAQVIEPALAAGQWVICDRFTDASYAYQGGGRGLAMQDIAALEAWLHPHLQPDLTLLVDLPPEVAAARLAASRAADRFEAQEQAFFSRVRAAYLQRAQTQAQRFVVLNGLLSPAEQQRPLLAALEPLFQQWKSGKS